MQTNNISITNGDIEGAKGYGKPFEYTIPLNPHRHLMRQVLFSSERFSNLLKVTQQVCVTVSIYIQACTLDFYIKLKTLDHLQEPKCRWNDYLLAKLEVIFFFNLKQIKNTFYQRKINKCIINRGYY